MKPAMTGPRLLTVTLITLAVVILSFSFLARLSNASLITRAENIPCEESKVESNQTDSTPLPASSSIIFESLTGHLLSISF
jgi:hypothetical protein